MSKGKEILVAMDIKRKASRKDKVPKDLPVEPKPDQVLSLILKSVKKNETRNN